MIDFDDHPDVYLSSTSHFSTSDDYPDVAVSISINGQGYVHLDVA
jgi:hypothetical protein